MLFIFFFSTIQGREISLCAQGCDASDLREAVKISVARDTIVIQSGEYSSIDVTIDKPLQIIGVGKAILNGKNKANVLRITSDHVTVDSLTIINSGNSDIDEYAGILIENASQCLIKNNQIENNTYGIYLAKSKLCRIIDNKIAADQTKGGEALSGNGIHLWDSHNVTIQGNQILGHRDGLYFEFSDELWIRKNQLKKNMRYGMHFMFSQDSIFEENLFWNNPTGVAIMYSERITVSKNHFQSGRNSSLGLLLKEINYSKFLDNTISDNTEALVMDSAAFNLFQRNGIYRNGLAIKIYGNCEGNVFEKNDISGNFFDITTNSKENRNSFHGNYWSKYKGYDLDKDGYGDRLYRPVQVFSFWLTKYPDLIVLFASAMSQLLESMERAFPVINPSLLFDEKPLMNANN